MKTIKHEIYKHGSYLYSLQAAGFESLSIDEEIKKMEELHKIAPSSVSNSQIVLSEADIQSLINGRDVSKKIDGKEIIIRQSYVKDMAAPVIQDRFEIKDTVMDNQLKAFRESMKNTYELGG